MWGKPLRGHKRGIAKVTFSPSGKLLASGSFDGTIRLWDVMSGKQLGEPLRGGRESRTTDVAFSPDGRLLAGSSDGNSLRLWSMATEQSLGEHLPISCQKSFLSFPKAVFSSDGKLLAISCGEGTLYLWDVGKQQLLDTFFKGNFDNLFQSGNKLLVTITNREDKTLQLLDIVTHQPLRELPNFTMTDIVLSPDGKLLAGIDNTNTIHLRGIENISYGKELYGQKNYYMVTLTFSPDSKLLASWNRNTLQLWDVVNGQLLGESFDEEFGIESIAFSPNSKLLVTGSDGKTARLKLWDISTGTHKLDTILIGHEDRINSIAFSPDGQFLISGSGDGIIRLWNMKTHQSLGQALRGHEHKTEVRNVAFSPNGKMLVSSSDDGTIMLWDVDPQSWYQKACRIAGRNLTYEEWQRYLPDEPYQKTCPQYPEGGGWEQVLFK